MENYKFIFWRKAEEFKMKEEAEKEFNYYICWVTGESDAGTEQREISRLEREFSKGATRGVVFDTCLDIPKDFFEACPIIKVLYKNEVKEFNDKEEAIAFLKSKANGEEYDPTRSNCYSEEKRCMFNVWLIEHGCCRVVDKKSIIPEGFYD